MKIFKKIERYIFGPDARRAAKELRLPWYGWVCFAVCGSGAVAAFDHFDMLDMAYPSMSAFVYVGAAVAIRWRLRREWWFWMVIGATTVLQALLLLVMYWGSEWIGVGAMLIINLSLFLILAALTATERYIAHAGPKKGRPNHADESICAISGRPRRARYRALNRR